MWVAPPSPGFQSLPLLPTIKLGPSGADSRVGGACARSRPLWVSPTNSPVRLGVSPAAASTPMGVFTQRFEALFPRTGALGCMVCFAPPPFLLVYVCTIVGLQGPPATTLWGLLAAAWPALFHNLPPLLGPPANLAMSSLHPAAHLHSSYQSGLMFLLHLLGCRTSIQFDFLSVLVVFCF